MALTALEIYKHLPKKNCGECGVPTCLAFAMQLASLKAQVEKCPYVTPQAKELLSASATPPIALVKFGAGESIAQAGDETVMFRHEKTFFHPTVVAVSIPQSVPEVELEGHIKKIMQLSWERIGQALKVDAIELKAESGSPAEFAARVQKAASLTAFPLIIHSSNPEMLAAGASACAQGRPLLRGAGAANLEKMCDIAKSHKCPLALRAQTVDELAALSGKAKSLGVSDLVLEIASPSPREALYNLVSLRRLAVKKSFRPIGHPVLVEPQGNGDEQALSCAAGIMKYASICVISTDCAETVLPLLTLRQNIFTDPQKPIQVKPGLYEIGKPTPQSPLYFTANFSLTYFTVKADIEKTKTGAHLLVVDTEGLSVMTAHAAGKLGPEHVAKALSEFCPPGKIAHKKLIIPGMLARISVKLREQTGLEIIVGPQDSSALPQFIRGAWQG